MAVAVTNFTELTLAGMESQFAKAGIITKQLPYHPIIFNWSQLTSVVFKEEKEYKNRRN